MAFDFPASPTDGQVYQPAGGPDYVYRTATGAWEILTSGGNSAFVAKAGDVMTGLLTLSGDPVSPLHAVPKQYLDANSGAVTISDTPPASPQDNSLWYESDTGFTYLRYRDLDTTQWVQFAAPQPTAMSLSSVTYVPQSLTPDQQLQARININAQNAEASVIKKNYVVNGGMQISQQNGTASSTVTSYPYFYPVDQFYLLQLNYGVQQMQQVASRTPGGSTHRIRVTCITIPPSSANTDALTINQRLEGARIADLKSGTAQAKVVTLQFGVKAPAGTYTVALWSGTRVYVCEYTITAGEANTDVVRSLTVQLDKTGTWPTDNGVGMNITWHLMTGSNYWVSPNVWQTSANSATSTNKQFNFMATAGNVFELFDVSLTEGPVAPPFTLPDYASELALCQRYWFALNQMLFMPASGFYYLTFNFPVAMRTSPTVTPYPESGMTGCTYQTGPTGMFQLAGGTGSLSGGQSYINARL